MASLSRQLAQWVVGLRYEDLPPDVVDRAKGVTLQGLASVLLGSLTPGGRQAIKLISEEEAGVKHGATIMVDGARVTRGGAAFANAEMAMAGGKWDTFRMLTHPGTSIIPRRLRRRRDRRRIRARLSHRPRGGLRGHGADGGRLHPHGDGARLPRRRRCSASSAPRSPPRRSWASPKTR